MSENRETQQKEMTEETVLEVSDIDHKFRSEISELPGAEKTMLCFQCGTCTADCPIARFSDFYRPRKLIRMTQLGLKDKLFSDDTMWLCSTCFTCVDHCPQDVGIASIVRALRNLSVKERGIPAVFKGLASNILKTGYAYIIPELRLKKRKEQGLPTLPKANLESVARLFDNTDLPKMLEKERI